MDSKYFVMSPDGTVDVAASANAFAKAVVEWKAMNEIPSSRIEAAVETVFDRFTGNIPMPALVSYVVHELSEEPAQHGALTDRVRAYLTAQYAKGTGRIEISRGKGGGVSRLARPDETIPARQPKKTA